MFLASNLHVKKDNKKGQSITSQNWGIYNSGQFFWQPFGKNTNSKNAIKPKMGIAMPLSDGNSPAPPLPPYYYPTQTIDTNISRITSETGWDPKDTVYTTTGFGRVVYIQTAVFHSSLHTHHQIVHTSHFHILSTPKPGGGVYLWGPKPGCLHPRTKYLLCRQYWIGETWLKLLSFVRARRYTKIARSSLKFNDLQYLDRLLFWVIFSKICSNWIDVSKICCTQHSVRPKLMYPKFCIEQNWCIHNSVRPKYVSGICSNAKHDVSNFWCMQKLLQLLSIGRVRNSLNFSELTLFRLISFFSLVFSKIVLPEGLAKEHPEMV